MGGCAGKPAEHSKKYFRKETNRSNSTNNIKDNTHHAGGSSKKHINAPNSFLDQILRINGVNQSDNDTIRECSRRLKEIRQRTLPANIVPNQVEGRVKLCEINASSILSRRASSPLRLANKGSGTESPITSSTDDKETLPSRQMKMSISSMRQKMQGINFHHSDVKEQQQQFPHRSEEIYQEISVRRCEHQSKVNDSGNCIDENVNLKEIYVTSIENSELKIQQQLEDNSHIHQRSSEFSTKVSRRSSPTLTKSKHAPPSKVRGVSSDQQKLN